MMSLVSMSMRETAPSTFSPLGRRGGRQRWQAPLPSGERSAERSGGWVRGSAALRTFTALFLAILFLVLPALAARAMDIQQVTSSKGINAWLVEDHSIPIVAIRFVFDGGSTQDPAGKEGLVNLMTGLFDEGAGDLDSEAFQTRLDDAGAEMGFDAARDGTYGSMRMLAEQKDAADRKSVV